MSPRQKLIIGCIVATVVVFEVAKRTLVNRARENRESKKEPPGKK